MTDTEINQINLRLDRAREERQGLADAQEAAKTKREEMADTMADVLQKLDGLLGREERVAFRAAMRAEVLRELGLDEPTDAQALVPTILKAAGVTPASVAKTTRPPALDRVLQLAERRPTVVISAIVGAVLILAILFGSLSQLPPVVQSANPWAPAPPPAPAPITAQELSP